LSRDKIAHLHQDGDLAVQGDAADESKLMEAGIVRARGLVAAARSDAENVFIVLTARSLRADLAIVARADVEESEPKLLRAGATRVILPYHITGRRLVTMLVRPDAADFLDEVSHTSGMELLLEQVEVSPGSALVGRTIAETWAAHTLDVTVLACKTVEGQWSTRPQGNSVVRAGSRLIALGTVDHLQKLIDLARR
jgi:voltage-gated potassium channel